VPPPPEELALAVVEGSLVGLFDASVGLPQFPTDFSGSTVEVARVDGGGVPGPLPEAEVGVDNTFRMEDVPARNAWVYVLGPNHQTRQMRWAIQEGTNTFEGITLLNDPDWINLPFNRMFLWGGNGLNRWLVPAEIVVISPNIDPGDVATALAELTEMTRGGFSGSIVVRKPTAEEREALDQGCDYSGAGARGKIFVGQGMNDEAYSCLFGDEGPGPAGEVAWARVRVRDDPDSVRHGLGHATGAEHPCGTSRPDPESLMRGSCGTYTLEPAPAWTDFDRQAFLFAYSRPVGTYATDDSRQAELMFGTVSNDSSAGE
jgi:hypothetical protein